MEAAMVLPLFGLLLIGLLECAHLMASYITLRNASAAAARAAVLFGATDAAIGNEARSAIAPMLNPAYLPDSNITITRDTSVTPPRVTVRLSYGLAPILSFMVLGQSGSWQLSAQTTMR